MTRGSSEVNENWCIWLTFVAPLPDLQTGWSNTHHCGCGAAEKCHHPSSILEQVHMEMQFPWKRMIYVSSKKLQL